jgi:hypothetical protein
VVVLILSVAPADVWAQIRAEDVAFDSEIRFLELNESGAYRRYSIVLTIDGAATITIDRDGEKKSRAVPLDECQALWQRLLELGLETLPDGKPEAIYPDQSDFTVEFQAAAQEGGFHAYGVDNIPDRRYRDIVEELVAFGNRNLERSRQP